MVLNEADDIRLGSGKVDAVYLGDTLIWPQVAYTYVVISTTIHYSAGTNIDAGSVGSMYSGNYAYVTGTVEVYRDSTLVDTLYDEPLTIDSVSSDFAVINEKVYGYNLGKQVTSAMLTTDVYVSYRTSASVNAGVVSQVRNTRSQTSQSISREYGTPTVSPRPVAGSYYVVLNANRYTTSGSPCPAYGSYATLTLYGGHNEANYSTTPWEDVQTTIYTYTSGATDTEYEVVDSGYTTPVKQGSEWGVDDTPTLTENVSWASYDSTTKEVTIDNAGQTIYTQPRACLLTATNGEATATITLYQQANVLESTTTTYDIYCHIVRSSDFPAEGGTFPVSYRSRKTTTTTYTSGSYSATTNATSNVGLTGATSATSTVSGSGTFNISLGSNAGGTKYVSVTITAQDDISQSASDWRYQEGAPVVAGILYPVVNQLTGVVSMKWEWNTASVAPTYPLSVDIDTLVYHWVLSGETTEHIQGVMGTTTVSFSANNGTFSLSHKITPHLEGTSGRSWFTASSVTGVYFDADNQSETFPTDKTFNVREVVPIEPGL